MYLVLKGLLCNLSQWETRGWSFQGHRVAFLSSLYAQNLNLPPATILGSLIFNSIRWAENRLWQATYPVGERLLGMITAKGPYEIAPLCGLKLAWSQLPLSSVRSPVVVSHHIR